MWACTALDKACNKSGSAIGRMLQVGGIDLVMLAMDTHVERESVQLAAGQLLLCLSSEKQGRDAIQVAGGGGRVKHAMAASNADPSLTNCVGPAVLRRLSCRAAESAASPVAGSLEALYRQIGHQVPRNARDQWKEKLEAPPTLELKPRNAEQDMWILRGKLGEKGGAVRIEVLREDKRIVCFLLSSTFTDTASERNLLIADVVPYLQQYARKYNFDFRLVEMRWGIRAEASSAHQTSEICMAELERCQRESQGFSYVFLG